MKVKCKNCGNIFEGNFCNKCGQPFDSECLDFHFLWHDLCHGLFHFDKGILYSFKELFTRPGHSIREFIEGKRVKHFKPVSLAIVLAVFYGLLYHSFKVDNVKPFVNQQNDLFNYEAYNEWVSTHFSWITLGTILFYTLGTYICFHRSKYNLVEFLTLNTFKASQRLFIHIITLPLLLYFNEPTEIKKIIFFIYVLDIVFDFVTNIQFFNMLPRWKTIFLSLMSHIIFLISMAIVSLIIICIMNHSGCNIMLQAFIQWQS
ncbi:DUF3667 domain-containing protein [Flavobacterium pedocola]